MTRTFRTNTQAQPRQHAGNPMPAPVSSPSSRLPGQPVPPIPRMPVKPEDRPGSSTSAPHRPGVDPQRPMAQPAQSPFPSQSPKSATPRPRLRRRRTSWLFSWHLWSTIGILAFSGSGLVAANFLFRLPMLPNCAGTFWPMASASKRIACAQELAEKRTSTDLLRAIELVNALPHDHPMRAVINLHIDQWANQLLDLSELDFQAGKLKEAIDHAERIPANTSAHRLVKDRIARWRKIWAKAEEIFARAEEQLRRQDWHQAFREAVRLQEVGNTYWETTKYQEFLDNLRQARSEGNKLVNARNLAEAGGMSNLLKAIQIVDKIQPESYMYREARKLVLKFSRQLLDLAEATLDGGDLQQAIAIARQIPVGANLRREVQDFIDLAQAQSRAKAGQLADLETAISLAQKLEANRPLYRKAQALIVRWQLEIEALGYLDRGRELASRGNVNDLASAIAELQNIPRSNPRWNEAQQEMSRWTDQIETIQDRPYLDEADALAATGDIGALQAAIDQAQRIRSGRALYQEAQTKIRKWAAQIETVQDRPYLVQAEQLADSGDYVAAINAAQAIPSGRALYREAQNKIQSWSNIIRARQSLQDAYRIATNQTPDALSRAIQTANRVPGSSNLRNEADVLINQWSNQLLSMAENQAMYNLLDQAIAIAQRIPPQAEAYDAAQQQIAAWRRKRSNATVETPVTPIQ